MEEHISSKISDYVLADILVGRGGSEFVRARKECVGNLRVLAAEAEPSVNSMLRPSSSRRLGVDATRKVHHALEFIFTDNAGKSVNQAKPL